MLRALILTIVSFILSPIAAAAPHLHLLYIVDTDADEVGADVTPGCEAGKKFMMNILDETFKGKEERLHKYHFDGEHVRPGNVLGYIRGNLSVGSDDTVWIHYCGHGAHDSDDGHFFATSKGNLLRSDLEEAATGKGARLVVITSDACSSPGTYGYPTPRRTPAEWAAFEQLFFHHRGLTNITAATAPQFAWINSERGGFFGQALMRMLCESIETLDDDRDGFVDWDEGFDFIRDTTNEVFTDARLSALKYRPSSKIVDATAQTAYAFSLARPDRPEMGAVRFSKTLRLVNSTDEVMTFRAKFYNYYDSSGWTWVPSASGNYNFTLEPGKITFLNDSLGQTITTNRFVYSASTPSGKTWGREVEVVDSGGYRSHKDETYNYVLRSDPKIEDVTVATVHNVYRYGLYGMLIRLTLVARRLLLVPTQVNALFYFTNDQVLKDQNGNYATPDGIVGLATKFKPIYLHTKYNLEDDDVIEMFMPYDELHLRDGEKHSLYFKVHFNVGDQTIWSGTTRNGFSVDKS